MRQGRTHPDAQLNHLSPGRGWCTRCRKAISTCYCADIRVIRSQIELVFLQHPCESRNSVGTARMAHNCLAGSSLIIGLGFEGNGRVDAMLDDRSRESWVLYPGPESINLSTAPPELIREKVPAPRDMRIFVIDGTWPNAKGMLRRSPRLATLPRLGFTSDRKSEYRIRRQPEEHCLSTLEASHELLARLEPAVDASALMHIFRAMVTFQSRFTDSPRFIDRSPTSEV